MMADGGDTRIEPADHTRGVQVGIAAYLIWGFLTIYWKQLSAFDAFELIGWRMLSAAIIMAALTTVRGRWSIVLTAMTDRATLARLLIATLLLTVNWGSYVWAVTNDRVIETALAYFIAPLGTMAIGVVILHERASTAQRLAFGLASIAVVILTVSSGSPPWVALIMAATWSLYGLTKRHITLGAVDGLAGETFVLFVPSIVIVAAMSGRSGSVVRAATGIEWGFVIGTGLVTALPLMLFASAAKSIPFTLLGPLNLLVPVVNFGLGWALYGEPMPIDRLVGFTFVWAALVVVMTERVRAAGRQTSGREVAAVT